MLISKPYRTGALVGKFMPAHRGHAHLIQFASQMCDHVTVVVDCVPNEWPSSALRAQKLQRDLAGLNITVVALPQVTPQEPGDHPDFWRIWKNLMIGACGGKKPDALVCAMEYGLPLAQVMESQFVPIDIGRDAIPISATQIRKDPWVYWDYILPHARLDYLTRVALEGPESTGKSTIGQKIASQLNFSWAPEWAKCWIEQQQRAGKNFEEKDLLTIAQGQVASEKSLEIGSCPVILSDSSLLSTITWSQFLYDRVDPRIISIFEDEEKRASRQRWFFTPETPWVDDVHRKVAKDASLLENRWRFWDLLLKNASEYGVSYTTVGGSFSEKENKILQLAQDLEPTPFLWSPKQSYDGDLFLEENHSYLLKAGSL